MSGLFNKKFTEQQDIQEGQVPDDLSDQPASIPLKHHDHKVEDKKPHHQEDQFIFQTVPDSHFENDYLQRDKSNYKNQQYYSSRQPSQKKEWDRQDRPERNERQRRQQKSNIQKSQSKKESQNYDSKRKQQPIQEVRQPMISQPPPTAMGYYTGMPPLGNPYTPGYYPPYGAIPPPQPGGRGPYTMYPQIHHQPPPGLFIQPQGPYAVQNQHIYQIPPPPIAYGTIPLVPPMPQLYHQQMMEPPRHINQQVKNYGYEQQSRNYQQGNYNSQKHSKSNQSRQRQESNGQKRESQYRQKYKQDRYSDERERSRDKKDYYDYQTTKSQQKQKYNDKYSQNYDQKNNYQKNYKNNKDEKKSLKQDKQNKESQQKQKLKVSINEQLKIIFAQNSEDKQQFLLVLRDVIKYRLLKKEQEQFAKFNAFQMAKPIAIYTLNKDLIQNNYQKALLKLQYLLIRLAKTQKEINTSNNVDKRDALILILTQLQLEDLVTKVKEMRLKKKLIGEKKMSEVKKILEELVKDPRKKIK